MDIFRYLKNPPRLKYNDQKGGHVRVKPDYMVNLVYMLVCFPLCVCVFACVYVSVLPVCGCVGMCVFNMSILRRVVLIFLC